MAQKPRRIRITGGATVRCSHAFGRSGWNVKRRTLKWRADWTVRCPTCGTLYIHREAIEGR